MQMFKCGNITDTKLKLQNLKVKLTGKKEKQAAVQEWNVKMKRTF